jgi:hypothetical protein
MRVLSGGFGRLDGLRVACGGCAHEAGVGCGQADAGVAARVIVGGGVGGAAVSLLGLGALAGAETRRRAGLPGPVVREAQDPSAGVAGDPA